MADLARVYLLMYTPIGNDSIREVLAVYETRELAEEYTREWKRKRSPGWFDILECRVIEA